MENARLEKAAPHDMGEKHGTVKDGTRLQYRPSHLWSF